MFEPEKLDLKSLDLTMEKHEELLRLFPEIRTEGGKIDFDRLKLVLGETVDVGKERYGMHWPGKADCFKTIQAPSMGTLRPCPEESVNFDSTENLIIEGDNLEVLKLLQKSYLGRVKMIYIDPPYNTGNDFIYPDNYSESLQTYLEYTGQADAQGRKFGTNADTDGRFHSKWMNMMYPRLYSAKNLLKEDGAIFISIDEAELFNLKRICDEIFGEENFIEVITWNKRIPKNDKGIGNIHEYILIYLKNSTWDWEFTMPKEGLSEINNLVASLKSKQMPLPEAEKELRKLYEKRGYDRGITLYNNLDRDYCVWGKINVSWPNANSFGPRYEVPHPISNCPVAVPDRGWRWKKETFDNLVDYQKIIKRHDGTYMCGQIWFDLNESTQPSLIKYLNDVDTLLLRSIISLKSDGGIEVEEVLGAKNLYSYPKPTSLIKLLVLSFVSSEKGEIVLDFFAGSGTTAQAVAELNKQDSGSRKFILIQLPEPTDRVDYPTIADITKERVRRIIKKLKDEESGKLDLENAGPQDLGFRVFKLTDSNFKPWDAEVPHESGALAQQLDLYIDHIKEGRSNQDLLFEILLKRGFPLTTPVELLTLAGHEVFGVSGTMMLVCLERDLSLDLIRAMADLMPECIVCLDEGFAGNDQLKTNAVQLFKTKGVAKFLTV